MALAVADIVNSATTSDADASTTREVALPETDVSAGDMMYICMMISSSGDIGDVLTTPSGWTLVAQHALDNTASTPRCYVYKRLIPGGGLGDTVNITSSASAICHAAVAFAVQDGTEELDHTSHWYTQTSQATEVPQLLARQTGGLTIRMIVSDDDDETSQGAMSGHSTVNWAEVATPGNGGTVQVWAATQGSVEVGKATFSLAASEQWGAFTFVIAETAPTAFATDEVRIELRSQSGLSANATVYTFPDMEYGVAGSNRKVVVVTGHQRDPVVTISSITVDGNSLASLKAVTDGTARQEAWGADIASGERGDIVVTWSGTANRCSMSCYVIYNAQASVHDDFTNTDDPLVAAITIPAKGALLANVWARVDNDPDFVFTNVDERGNRATEFAGTMNAAATKGYSTLQTDLDITANPDDATPISLSMIGISWAVVAAAATPKGPLGLPLHGPFGGPI